MASRAGGSQGKCFLDAGKTMGLSSYGSGRVDLFNEEYGHSLCSKELYAKEDSTGYYGNQEPVDLAYNLQKSAERHAIYMVRRVFWKGDILANREFNQ